MSDEILQWYKGTEVARNVWAFHEYNVTFYLVIGKERSMLIDTGWGIGDLEKLSGSMGIKYLDVVLTHGHPDHVGGAYQFPSVRISPEDLNAMNSDYSVETRQRYLHGSIKPPYPDGFSQEIWTSARLNRIEDLEEGQTFDLGGRILEVIAMPGHTAGSVCLLDAREGLLFSGDSIQEQVLLHLETSLPLDVYRDSLKHVLEFRSSFHSVFPCHGASPQNLSLADELLNGVNDILAGKIKGVLRQTYLGEGLVCRFGGSSVIYKEDRLNERRSRER
jgi:hydroxyacylglutathione hydrolase